MGYPHGGAAGVWEDGSPTPTKPQKSQIRDWGALVEARAGVETLAEVDDLAASAVTTGSKLVLAGTRVEVVTSGEHLETPGGIKLKVLDAYVATDFGIPSDGTDATAAWNALIAVLNAEGAAARSSYTMLTVVFPNGSYSLKGGGRTALLVSNVRFLGGPDAHLIMEDDPFVLAGSAAQFIENIYVEGFHPTTATSVVPLRKPKAITGATKADPVVITSAAHGYVTGQKVRIMGVGGMTQINSREFTVTVIDTDSYSLDDEDGTDHSNYTSGGTAWPATDCALVFAQNAARIFINGVQHYRMPHLFKGRAVLGPDKAITGATQADPVVITCPGHGLSTGHKTRITGVGGMVELNWTNPTVTVIDANSYSLDGVDGTGFTAYTSGGISKGHTSGLSTISVATGARDNYGTTHPSYNPVDIDTTTAAFAAGLYTTLHAYPYTPPTNPAVVPKPITGATQANPVVITCVGHGLPEVNKVRFRDVGGMTELNGNDYEITVIDEDSFSIDVDGTGFTAYTSGGAVAGVHWANEYKTAPVAIDGKWDTALQRGGVLQHYNWAWKLRATGSMSFIREIGVDFDYFGEGYAQITYAGGNVTDFVGDGGRIFAMNGDFIDEVVEAGGSIIDLNFSGFKIALLGGEIINDTSGRLKGVTFEDLRVERLTRLKSGTSYGFNFAAANAKPVLRNIEMEDPEIRNGTGADDYLYPTEALKVAAAVTSLTVTGCRLQGRSKTYDITDATAGDGAGRVIADNSCVDESMPEYKVLRTPTVTTGLWTWRNRTGAPQTVAVSGGTVTDIRLSYLDASGSEVTTTTTGMTSGFVQVANGQLITINNSSVPQVRIFPAA